LNNKEYYLDKSKKNKEKYRSEFAGFMEAKACIDCGIEDRRVLEFDHIADDKDYNIADRAGTIPLKTLMKEIDKCEIVCANCHRIRTAERRL